MKYVLIIIALFTLNLKVNAQISLCDSSGSKGQVRFYVDDRINQMVAPPSATDAKKPDLRGYRIQIYAGTDRNQATKIKNQFVQLYPDVPAYLEYQSPDFKVRVGDYRNKLEAQRLLHELKEKIGGGILLVPEKINFPELKP